MVSLLVNEEDSGWGRNVVIYRLCRLYWTQCTSTSRASTSCKRTTYSACAGTRSTRTHSTRRRSLPSPRTRTSRSHNSRSTTILSLKAFATTASADGNSFLHYSTGIIVVTVALLDILLRIRINFYAARQAINSSFSKKTGCCFLY